MDYEAVENFDMNQALEEFCGVRFDRDRDDKNKVASNWEELEARLAAASSKLEQFVSIESAE